MSNALPAQEWLDIVKGEYLDGFIKDGGAAIKFAVPTAEGPGSAVEDAPRGDGIRNWVTSWCLWIQGETRVHMPQEIFFRIAQQVDWRLLARRVVLRICLDLGIQD